MVVPRGAVVCELVCGAGVGVRREREVEHCAVLNKVSIVRFSSGFQKMEFPCLS